MALYYEDQKPAALAKAKAFRGRVPTFFSKFESSITKFGSGFLTKEVSYADLALFQLVEGVRLPRSLSSPRRSWADPTIASHPLSHAQISYAFPKFAKKIQPDFPGIWALRDRIAGAPRIASYLKSERREPFNELGVFRYYPELDEP